MGRMAQVSASNQPARDPNVVDRPLDILGVGSDDIVKMDNRQLLAASRTILEMQQTFRKENQIMF